MAKKLTKAERHSLNAHVSWDEWGAQFGFRLYGSTDEWVGHFILPEGTHFIVPKAARDAIDAIVKYAPR